MISDIEEELRHAAEVDDDPWDVTLYTRAADTIAALRAAGDALMDALHDARRRHPCDCADGYDQRSGNLAVGEWRTARHGVQPHR